MYIPLKHQDYSGLQSKVQFRHLSLQVLEREQIMKKFHEVTTQLEQALGGVHYEELDISDEVKEQVKDITLLSLQLLWMATPLDVQSSFSSLASTSR